MKNVITTNTTEVNVEEKKENKNQLSVVIKERGSFIIAHIIFLFLIGLFLELGVSSGLLSTLFFTSPSLLFASFSKYLLSGLLLSDLLITLWETVLGFLVGCGSGIFLGLLLSRFRLIARFLDPYMIILYSTPSIVIAPLLVLFFGIGIESKVALIFAHTFLVLYIAVYGSAIHVEEDLINAAKVMGASEKQIFWKIIFPSTGSAIQSGLKLGIGVSLIGAIVGEFIGAKAGIGYRILYSSSMMDISGMFVGIMLIAFLAIILNLVINQLGRILVHYKYYDHKGASNMDQK